MVSILEDSNPQIKTNLNENQLVHFRSYDEDSKSNLSICSDENPIWIEFPKIYLWYNVSISVIGSDYDGKHNSLKLVLLPSQKYSIHNKEIIFKITQNNLKLKLDFFGIQFLDNKDDNTDDIDVSDKAYKRNTARLLINIYDIHEKSFLRYKSQIIGNKNNLEVSKNISVSSIKREECQKNSNPIENPEICFLINQIEFYYEESRELGSYIDNREIKEVFSTILDYDVHPIISKTTKKLKDAIQEKLREVQGYHRHIVVFVLSHGDNNEFCTKDGTITFDEFVKLFRQNCDKPIIFFFNCCQGRKYNILKKSNSETPENESVESNFFFKIENASTRENIFMGFSTVPGYYSFRYNDGSPYIQKLLNVIEENPGLDVKEIHRITQKKMREMKDLIQISCFYDLLKEHDKVLGKNSSIKL